MWRHILFSLILYSIMVMVDEVFKEKGDYSTIHRNRMFKFALYQDLLIILSILKMIVIEGHTLSGVLHRFRNSGLTTQLYLATAVILHGTLLFDENTDHKVRLNPAPYIPPTVDEDRKDLFLL